jgi:hypothetical protein
VRRKIGEGLLGDVLRKVPIGGVDGLRLPADVKRVVVQNIESLRESVTDIFAQEVSKVLSRMDFQRLADNVFRSYSLHVEAKIELRPKKKRNGRAQKR